MGIFVCKECLTLVGISEGSTKYQTIESFGPCDLCDKDANCKDIHTHATKESLRKKVSDGRSEWWLIA